MSGAERQRIGGGKSSLRYAEVFAFGTVLGLFLRLGVRLAPRAAVEKAKSWI